MASVRERKWNGKKAYVVDYVDPDGRRRLQTFRSNKAAEIFRDAIVLALRSVEDSQPVKPVPAEPLPRQPANAASTPLDLLWGADAIGKAINRSPRQTFHMLEAGLLPAKKLGKQWVVSWQALASLA